METIPYSPPTQPAAPGVESYGAAAPAAAASIPLAGTNTGGDVVEPAAPSVLPVATPVAVVPPSSVPVATPTQVAAPELTPVTTPQPAPAPSSVPIATPGQPAVPALAPVATPDGQSLPSPVTQEQLALAVAQVNATIVAGTIPVVTRPDGTKVELTVDNDNNIGEVPIP